MKMITITKKEINTKIKDMLKEGIQKATMNNCVLTVLDKGHYNTYFIRPFQGKYKDERVFVNHHNKKLFISDAYNYINELYI